MSSPNLAGCLALIVSGLKSEKIVFTPYLIHRAIQNTGKDINDPMNIGLIQVDETWKYLKHNSEIPSLQVSYEVRNAFFRYG